MDRISRDCTPPDGGPPPGPTLAQLVARLERRLARLERLLDASMGAYLHARFPYGDGKGDRWGRR